MAHDFLGNELSIGDDVVFLNYNVSSASLERGKITRVSEHTAEISGKRRAEYKIIKVNPVKPTMDNTWIPCSDRLPEDGTECNVVWVNHDPQPYYRDIKDKPFTAAAVFFRGAWYWYSSTCLDILEEYGHNFSDDIDKCIEITHWMPLPEPPKEVLP